jgi:hypothetical protein
LEVLFANGDLDTLEEMLAPDFVDRSLLPSQGSSREEYKQWAVVACAALSFADFTVEDQIVQGDVEHRRAESSLPTIPNGRCMQTPEYERWRDYLARTWVNMGKKRKGWGC